MTDPRAEEQAALVELVQVARALKHRAGAATRPMHRTTLEPDDPDAPSIEAQIIPARIPKGTRSADLVAYLVDGLTAFLKDADEHGRLLTKQLEEA